jgi:hypothetical protein
MVDCARCGWQVGLLQELEACANRPSLICVTKRSFSARRYERAAAHVWDAWPDSAKRAFFKDQATCGDPAGRFA